jgi:hypothetical protein
LTSLLYFLSKTLVAAELIRKDMTSTHRDITIAVAIAVMK